MLSRCVTWSAGLAMAICVAHLARAQTPFYPVTQGASFAPGLAAPMDLAAAISDASPNIPNSGGYLVQFTNGGRYIFRKNTQQFVSSTTQWEFWCNGTGLAGCDPSGANQPFDTD